MFNLFYLYSSTSDTCYKIKSLAAMNKLPMNISMNLC